jgi:hypothetical protein
MDDQDMMNQQAAVQMARANYQSMDNNSINTLLAELTDVDTSIDEIELLLQGKIIKNGEEVVTCEPLCNKEGAANMRRFLKAFVSRIMLMSNFEDEQIRRITEEIGYDVIEDLTYNKLRYGIKHPKAIATISDLVINNGFACLMSALENGLRKMLRSTTVETTINTQGQGVKSGKGGIGALLGLGRK